MSTAWMIVIICQWVVIVGLGIVVTGVLRRVATTLEAQAATGPSAGRRIGPVNGSPLPGIVVGDSTGRHVVLSGVPGPFVLAILTSHCAPCLAIADGLRAHPERLRGAGRLVVVTDADGRAVIDLERCATVLTDDDGAAFDALDVPGTPFVVVVDAAGRVNSSSLLSGTDQLLRMLGVPESGLEAEIQVEVAG